MVIKKGEVYMKRRFLQPYRITDRGGEPAVIPLRRECLFNRDFRSTVYTGGHFQVTLMCIPAGESIGLETHPHTDQMLYIEKGYARIEMGETENGLNYRFHATAGDAVFVPAGTYHNIYNIGSSSLKLFSVYAPPQHPFGTVHETKREAEEAEKNENAQH